MQILKENKDKKDAEFNERFKHSECPTLSNIIFLLHFYENEIHLTFWWKKRNTAKEFCYCLVLTHSIRCLQDRRKLWMMTRRISLINGRL